MIDIPHNKLYSRNCVEEYLSDGSVRLTTYITPPKTATELLTLAKSYYGITEYTVRVNLPPERKPDIVIIVSHTSANNWRLISCTLSHVDTSNLNTLTEVNQQLHGLLDK